MSDVAALSAPEAAFTVVLATPDEPVLAGTAAAKKAGK